VAGERAALSARKSRRKRFDIGAQLGTWHEHPSLLSALVD
jgi:hypothetical protein